MESDSLEDHLEGSDEVKIVNETEFHAIANRIFDDTVDNRTQLSSSDQNTNLHPFEIRVILANDIVFRFMERTDIAPTRGFKRLKKSERGWATSKLVESKKADNENKAKDGFFKSMGSLGGLDR